MNDARSTAVLGAILTTFAMPPQLALATTMFEEKFTCPVGGEKFEDYVIGSHTSWGQRPDGRSYGTLTIYPIVECPGNGFLLFEDEFTAEELAKLEPLVSSADYQAMRSTETQNYRVWWLMDKIGRDPQQLATVLLRASWETDEDQERKIRYQAAFIAAATGLVRTPDNADTWFWLNLRAANALRELGYYDRAAILLDRIDMPERVPADPDQREGARFLIDGLRTLIAEQNPVPEPATLIPIDMAVFRCVVHSVPPSPSEQAKCDSAELRKAISEFSVENDAGEDLQGEPAVRFLYERFANPSAPTG